MSSSDQGVSQPGVQVTKRPTKDRSKRGDVEIIVTRDWTVAEIIAQYPQATEIMAEYGLHCFGCSVSAVESIAEGCRGHGFTEEDIDLLIEDINDCIATIPPRPQVLTLTKDAALAILEIAKKEEVEGQGLSVQANSDGSFFMEFRVEMEEGEKEFVCEEVPDVKVWASVLTLQRIGGATIDCKDGRFKLEVGGSECCGGDKEKCGCK